MRTHSRELPDLEPLHALVPLRHADDAICIGPPESPKSYLDISRIIAAAEVADDVAVPTWLLASCALKSYAVDLATGAVTLEGMAFVPWGQGYIVVFSYVYTEQ